MSDERPGGTILSDGVFGVILTLDCMKQSVPSPLLQEGHENSPKHGRVV